MPPARYRALVLYALWSAAMQFEWLRFAPVANATAEGYGVTLSAVAWLSLLFPLLFLPLALPWGWLIDRWPLRRCLLLAAALTCAGALLRAMHADFGLLLAGTVLMAVAQPLLMALIARLADSWFDAQGALRATAVATASLFIGIGAAFALAPLAVGDVAASLHVDALLLLALLLLSLLLFPADRGSPRTGSGQSWGDIFALFKRPLMLPLLGLIFFGNGYFNSVFTWLEPMLGSAGIDSAQAGVIGLCVLLGGVAGLALVSMWAPSPRRIPSLLLLATIAAVPLTLCLTGSQSFGTVLTAGLLLGALMLAPLPLLIAMVARTAGPARSGIAMSAFWLSANADAAAIIAALGPFADHQWWRAAGFALCLPLLLEAAIVVVFLRPARPRDGDMPEPSR